jgi:putative SOS response-associated peptidase YedK
MCGRFSQSKSKQDIKKRFNVKKVADDVIPLFNVAPDSDVAAILNDSPDEIKAVHWGLIPSWSKTENNPYNMINAKGEELLEKNTFKPLIKSKRCLICAESFY